MGKISHGRLNAKVHRWNVGWLAVNSININGLTGKPGSARGKCGTMRSMTEPAKQQTTTTEQMPDWLNFARSLLGLNGAEILSELMTNDEVKRFSDYLDTLLHTARQDGEQDAFEDGWSRGYRAGIQYCIDYLRLVEEPRRPERGT